ncbi:MAG: DUF2145 domain-containing protein [Pseudomonadota bacterium]
MRRLILLLLAVCSIGTAHAGATCEPRKRNDAGAFVKAIKLAETTRATLDASKAQVALVGRVGRDLSRYHLRYSHMAYVWRDHPKGKWIVVHELNQCGTASSALYDQGLANFFLDDLFAYDAAILIPSPASQARIVAMLGSSLPTRLHSPRYNMLAYPMSTQYQNSNGWVLETYAASSSEFQISDRRQAQAWLRMAGYRPTNVHVSAGERLGARLFSANVSFDDHPFGRRMAGHIDTVTVESVLRFVRERDPGAVEKVVSVR